MIKNFFIVLFYLGVTTLSKGGVLYFEYRVALLFFISQIHFLGLVKIPIRIFLKAYRYNLSQS